MKAILGKDKYTGQPAPYATHAEAVQVGTGNNKRKLSELIPDTAKSNNKLATQNYADNAVTTHQNDTNIHVTKALQNAWTAKYDKPSTGIPKADLAQDVQNSLGKADTALQDRDLTTLRNKVAALEALIDSDSDGAINKWNEIVDFLNGISEDNVLDTLLTGKANRYDLEAPNPYNTAPALPDTHTNGVPFYNGIPMQERSVYINESHYKVFVGSISDEPYAYITRLTDDEKYHFVGGGIIRSLDSTNKTILCAAYPEFAKYDKPSTGIPMADLAQDVQTSLGKADSAYQKPSTGIPESDLNSNDVAKHDYQAFLAAFYGSLGDSSTTDNIASVNFEQSAGNTYRPALSAVQRIIMGEASQDGLNSQYYVQMTPSGGSYASRSFTLQGDWTVRSSNTGVVTVSSTSNGQMNVNGERQQTVTLNALATGRAYIYCESTMRPDLNFMILVDVDNYSGEVAPVAGE